jgi:hypothetical protein
MPFNRDEIVQYVGIPERKIELFPLEFNVLPEPVGVDWSVQPQSRPYFIWTTNASMHKNHEIALRGIRRYLERLDGQLDVVVTGVDTENLLSKATLKRPPEYVRRIRRQLARASCCQSASSGREISSRTSTPGF